VGWQSSLITGLDREFRDQAANVLFEIDACMLFHGFDFIVEPFNRSIGYPVGIITEQLNEHLIAFLS
jgi:hypothetical protein